MVVFAGLLAGIWGDRCVFVDRFVSILIHHPHNGSKVLQFGAPSPCSAFGNCWWVLKQTARDITRLVKGHREREHEDCSGEEVAFLPLPCIRIHLSVREYIGGYRRPRTTVSRPLSPSIPARLLEGCSQEIVSGSTKELGPRRGGDAGRVAARVFT